jgi:GntP family gluconate:H+ symporter
MPLLHALILGLAALAVAALTARGRVHAVLALTAAAVAFAYGSGLSLSLIGKVFGTGFGQALNMPGLVVLAAAMIAAMAARSGGAARLDAATSAWPGAARTTVLAVLHLVAGTGASPAAAFAALGPLREGISGAAPRRLAVTASLAISAGQGLLLPSPVLIAACAILGAGWARVLAIGVPLAILATWLGAVAARAVPQGETPPPLAAAVPGARAAAGVAVACLVMAALLAVQSLGDIPSEPFGGGSVRETILGAGRPLTLLLAGLAIAAVTNGGWRRGGLSESGWAADAIAHGAPLLLVLGAAGGLQALAQNTHMAELLAERVSAPALGLAVPFLAAAIMKALQGSSLTAAITAAGMAQPLLAALGLDTPSGHALAALAVGAGATALPHINDPLFWLTADAAALRPGPALAIIPPLTALQTAAALVGLVCVGAVG